MRTPMGSFRIPAALVALVLFAVLPQAAHSAKVFGSLSVSPASTNVTVGVATNVTATVTLATTSGGSQMTGTTLLSTVILPAEPSIAATVTPATNLFPVKPYTTNATLTVATAITTPANTYTIQVIGSSNPPNSTLVTPITNTFTLVVSTGPVFSPLLTWSGAGSDLKWSTAANWSPSGPPVSSNDLVFANAGVTNSAGLVDNVVDSSLSVRSLTYSNTAGFHTTLLDPGVTVTLAGTNGLSAGIATDTNLVTMNAITGAGGTLVVSNTSANVLVSQSHAVDNPVAQAQLDLSGLDNFSANVARMLVGADLSIKGAGGLLKLAKTNTVTMTTGSTAPQLDIGDNTLSQGIAGTNSTLFLGQTNAIFADSIAVGRGKNTGNGGAQYTSSLLFNSEFSSPAVYFRGTGGATSRVGIWSIGDALNGKSAPALGVNDFSAGILDALVDTMYVGKSASVSGGSSGSGTLILGAGTLDVNTLKIGYSDLNSGNGTVTLTGGLLQVNTSLELAHDSTITANGTLNIYGGTVMANAGITMGGGVSRINISSGTLDATNTVATVGAAGAPLAFMTLTNSTLNLPVKNGAPTVLVDNYFASGGTTNIINITSLPLLTSLPAQFPLIAFIPADIFVDGDFNLGLGSLPPGGYAGYVSNNVANFSVDIVITAGPVTPVLVWDGAASGDWDTVTANWKTNGVPTTYSQGYPLVQFDDSLTGTNVVNLTTSLTPGSLTVNNSLSNYTFVGAGNLSGPCGLIKSGTGTLTLDNSASNDFTGGVSILAGTLQIGQGDTNGNLPLAGVADNGLLSFNRSDNVTVADAISGSGAVAQLGPGILTLSGANAFADVATISGGVLRVGSAAALGTTTGGTIITNNGTLDVNGFSLGLEPVTVSGAGVGGGGAIVNNGASQSKVLRSVTLAGSATFGGAGDWDIGASANNASDASLASSSSAFKLSKVNTNTATLLGVVVDPNLGDIDVQGGTLSFERNTSSLGNPANTITVFSNAALQFVNVSNVWNKAVVLQDGATLKSGSGANTFGGPLTLQGSDTISVSGTSLTLTNSLGGAGGLTKSSGGALILTAANGYTGSTLVNSGALALTGAGSLSASSNLNVAAGATLDASGRSDATLTLSGGQTLKGNGTVLGAVIAGAGSTLAPGSSLGALTVSNTLTLQPGSSTVMELNKAAGTNDQVRGLTSVTYGGTLTVTGLGGAYSPGDIFKLFSAGTYVASSFATLNLPVNVTWDTSGLTVDGTIKVVSVAPPQVGSIAPASGGAFQLSFSGPAGNNYRVWASTNAAATPVSTTWTVVSSGLFDTTGTASFTDTAATNYPARFYLISVP